jgi:hypothetical protein
MFERNPGILTRTQAFKNLLCAMYNEKYELDADACRYADELVEMAVLGRLNGALPAASKSLSTVLHLDSTVKSRVKFRGCPRLLLVSATDLRLPKLFKDALIFTLGPWEEPEFVLLRKKSEEFPEIYPQLLDRKVIKITEDAYSKLCAKILSLNKALLADLAPIDQKINVQFKDSRTVGLNAASQTSAKRSMTMTSYVRRASTSGCTTRSRKGMLRKLSENISSR